MDREHLRLFSIRRAADKLKYLAGSHHDDAHAGHHSATGAFVDDIVPEKAAQTLRGIL